MLNQFHVEDASVQRNYFLTFHENGFYKTLKKRVGDELKTIDTGVVRQTEITHDINLIVLFLSIVAAARCHTMGYWIVCNIVAAFSIALSVSFAHSFIHKADNWRMFTMNLSMCSWRGARVTHVLVTLIVMRNCDIVKLKYCLLTVSPHVP